PGYHSIANHLNRGQNTLDEVIPDAPDGSVLYKFNPATQSYYSPAQFLAGFGWLYQEPEMGYLKPGEGAFLQVNVSASLSFSGGIAQFPLPRQVAVGRYHFVSGQAPRSMSFPEVFVFEPVPGDVVSMYDNPIAAVAGANPQGASSI